MVASSRLDRWLAPRLAARSADTARFVDGDPVDVAIKRGGAVLPGTTRVRIVRGGTQALDARGQASASTSARVTVVAQRGVTLLKDDLLQVPGGVVIKIGYVPPGQRWGVEADAEVLA